MNVFGRNSQRGRDCSAVSPLESIAFDNAPAGIAVLAADTTILSVNRRFAQTLSREPGELVGVKFTSLVEPAVHDDGGQALYEALMAAVRDGNPPPRNVNDIPAPPARREVCLHAGGSDLPWTVLRWLAVEPGTAGAASGTAGGAALVVFATRLGGDRDAGDEIHELRDQVGILMRSGDVGMAILTLDGVFLDVNEGLVGMLGYTREEFMSMSFKQIIHPDDWDKTVSNFAGMVAKRLERHQTIKRYICKDGRTMYCRRIMRIARDAGGAPRSIMVQIEPRGVA